MTQEELDKKLDDYIKDAKAGLKVANKALEVLEQNYWERDKDIEEYFHSTVGDIDEAAGWFGELAETMAGDWKNFDGVEKRCEYCEEPYEYERGGEVVTVSHRSCAYAIAEGY